MLALLFGAAVLADSAIVRRGLAAILEGTADLRVIASGPLVEAGALQAQGVHVFVEDVPDEASVELVLSQLPARVPVLALVAEPDHGRALVRGGARGVLGRDAPGEQLTAASLAVAAGLHVFDGETFAPLLMPARAADVGLLTARERSVLELVATGLSNRAIAERLGVSEHTAKFHVQKLLDKLGADTRADAVARAARRGLLTL